MSSPLALAAGALLSVLVLVPTTPVLAPVLAAPVLPATPVRVLVQLPWLWLVQPPPLLLVPPRSPLPPSSLLPLHLPPLLLLLPLLLLVPTTPVLALVLVLV